MRPPSGKERLPPSRPKGPLSILFSDEVVTLIVAFAKEKSLLLPLKVVAEASQWLKKLNYFIMMMMMMMVMMMMMM